MSDAPGPPAKRPTAPEDFPERGPFSIPAIWQRALARLFDLALVAFPLATVVAVLAVASGDPVDPEDLPGWLLPAQISAQVVYETIAVAVWGRTLGKLLLGLRVTRYLDGKRPTWTQSAQRIVLPSVVGALPFSGSDVLEGCVYLTSVFDPLKRGWHDRYAGTLVLRTR